MANFPLSIARRLYATPDKNGKASNPAIRIAIAGIAIGITVMIISVAVVLGFKHTIQSKVVGFGSHITVGNFLSMHGFEPIPVVMGDSMLTAIKNIEGVKSVSPYAMAQGILKTDEDFLGFQLKGVGEAFDTTFISENLIQGRLPQFSEKKSTKELLVSKSQADKLNVKSGDKIYAYFINGSDVRTRKFTITGVYQTNLSAFDNELCFTDLKTTRSLNGYEDDQADGTEVLIKDFSQLDSVAKRFVKQVNRKLDRNYETYSSQTVLDMYPGIFSWLDLLDLNVWIILCLMVAVAGFTIISGLLIIILERTSMIGLLKALGMRNKGIRHTFIWLALLIVCKGLIIGNVVAFVLMLIQKYTGVMKLDPSIYFVTEVPLEFNIPVIVAVNICTLIISSLILILPSMLVSHISPSKVMRYE